MMEQNLSRGEMALLALLQFSSGEEWLCKVVAKVTVQRLFLYFFFYFFFGGSVPYCYCIQSKAHLYI